jgi:hypothetical protein
LLEGADTLTLNSDATVAQALGGAANSVDTEARGLYTITGLNYSISDTVTNMIAGLAGIDSAGISFATSLKASDTTAMSVADAVVLTSLSNFAGYDDAGTVNVVEHNYYIADGFAALQAADTALIDGATTVVANGTDDGATTADNIDLSMHSKAMTINGNDGADSIIGTSGNDTITGGAGVDIIDGGDGNDVYVLALQTDSSVATGAAITPALAGIDTVAVTVGDKFDITGVTATLGQAAAVALTYTDATPTGTEFAAALEAAATVSAGQAWLFSVTGAGGASAYTGYYLVVAADATISDNDYIVKLTGVTTIGVATGDVTIAS